MWEQYYINNEKNISTTKLKLISYNNLLYSSFTQSTFYWRHTRAKFRAAPVLSRVFIFPDRLIRRPIRFN